MAKGKKGKKLSKEEKRRKKASKKPAIKPPPGFDGPGDLRAVEYHVDQWQHGVEEGLNMLLMLGRDAAFIVNKLAKERGNEEIEELGRRLVATRPQLETNLYELRIASVGKLVDEALPTVPNAAEAGALKISGGAFALFDPKRLAEELARGGRPRKDPARMAAGDVVVFGLDAGREVPVQVTTAALPDGQPALEQRLVVESGVIFLGPPQASDGPRMGSLRLDPFSTSLNEHLSQGHLLRLKSGVYRVAAHQDSDGGAVVHLKPDDSPDAPLEIDPKQLSLPALVDGGPSEG